MKCEFSYEKFQKRFEEQKIETQQKKSEVVEEEKEVSNDNKEVAEEQKDSSSSNFEIWEFKNLIQAEKTIFSYCQIAGSFCLKEKSKEEKLEEGEPIGFME